MKKKPSLADIAKALGVSKTLVSMVLNGKGDKNGINKETQKKVWAKAKELNYTPNIMARSLRMGKTHTIGLIVADISNSFYAKMCRSVEDAASKKGYHVLFGSSDENPEKERKLIRMFQDRQVDGLIITTTLENNDFIEDLKGEKTPFVLFDRFIPDSDAPFVTADNYNGSIEAVEHMIGLGVEQIALLTISPSHLTSITERVRGYKEAMSRHGIEVKDGLIREIPYNDIRGAMKSQISELLKSPYNIRGLFVANNNLAVAAIECLQDLGKRIPEDVALVSFDDIDLFRFYQPQVTAVAQPIQEMGEKSVEILLDLVENDVNEVKEKQVFMPTSLVVRKSSGLQLDKTKA